MSKPSAILMGSKPGSAVALEILLQRGWEVKCAVASTQSVTPWLVGQDLSDSARTFGIKLIDQEKIPRDEKVDFVISYMFRRLVKRHLLETPRRAALNFHAAPLPGFGGWAFYNVAIVEGVSEYGCTCHYMDEGFDSGPILKVRRFPIDPRQETAYSLEQKAQAEMVRLFVDFCVLAETREELPLEKQDKEKVRYFTRRDFEELREIPSGASEETIDRYARAFFFPPYQCAQLRTNGTIVEVLPRLGKEQIAKRLHQCEKERLLEIAREYSSQQA